MTSVDQSRANLEAIFRHYGFPPLRLVTQFEDRCEWEPTLEWFCILMELVTAGKFRPWNAVSNHGVQAKAGFRENVPRCSMQIILHGGQAQGTDRRVEADIDRWNPDFGVGPGLIHFAVDVLGPKASPAKIAAALRKRGIEVDFQGE